MNHRDNRDNSDPRYCKLRQCSLLENMSYASKTKGIGGTLKASPFFFIVEELPLVEADGNGPHWLVEICKVGIDTNSVCNRLSKLFKIKPIAIGYGGLKDAQAKTTQSFTLEIPGTKYTAEDVKNIIENDDTFSTPLQVIELPKRNSKKLRKGITRGNRFKILVTDLNMPVEEAYTQALAIKQELGVTGIPNYFGSQRLGSKCQNALAGYKELLDTQAFVDEQLTLEKSEFTADASKGELNANPNNDLALEKSEFAADTSKVEWNTKPDSELAFKKSELAADTPKRELNAKPGNELALEKSELTADTLKGDELNSIPDDEHLPKETSRKRKTEINKGGLRKWRKKNRKGGSWSTFASTIKKNAFQSAIFNIMVSSRIDDGLFSKVQLGESVQSEDGGKIRLVEGDVLEKNFAVALPLIGCTNDRVNHPHLSALESKYTLEYGLSNDAFRLNELFTTYRVARLSAEGIGMDIKKIDSIAAYLDSNSRGCPLPMDVTEGPALLFTFNLPSGSYATSVLREFQKHQVSC